MVEYQHADVSAVFGALADPTRRAIVEHLAQRGEATIIELAQPFEMSLEAVSKHIRVLERAGLVGRRKVGRSYRCHLAEPARLHTARQWLLDLESFWQQRLDSLADYLATPKPQE